MDDERNAGEDPQQGEPRDDDPRGDDPERENVPPGDQPDGDAEEPDAEDAEDDDPEDDDEDASDGDEDDGDDSDDDEDEEGLYDLDDDAHPEPEVTIEVSGLSLYTHTGVADAERQVGQRLLIDLRLDVGETDATVTDRIEDTVDYGEVCEFVALIAQQHEYRTLERLCATIADRLIERYDLHAAWVKAAKPEPPIPLQLSEVSVEVWREA
jgi:dihydroneopterin aldolase